MANSAVSPPLTLTFAWTYLGQTLDIPQFKHYSWPGIFFACAVVAPRGAADHPRPPRIPKKALASARPPVTIAGVRSHFLPLDGAGTGLRGIWNRGVKARHKVVAKSKWD